MSISRFAGERELPESVSVLTLAWVGVAALFVGVYFAAALRMPVGGVELAHLSGAWNASIGADDDRYVPTIFQAVTALLFNFTTSETPARLVAFAATSSGLAAIYLLRGQLGEPGALIAAGLFALNVPLIALGASASAMGFDLALVLWLAVLLDRGSCSPFAWGAAASVVATAGPVALPLVAAATAVGLYRRASPPRATIVAAALGAAAGILAASLRFGMGWDGLRVPPLDLFVDSYDGDWSTITGWGTLTVYSWPIILPALAVVGLRVWQVARAGTAPSLPETVLGAWVAISLLWFVTSASEGTFVPLAALAVPLVLVLATALARAISAMARADWGIARLVVPMIALALTIAAFFVLDWTDTETVGSDAEKLAVAVALVAAGTASVYLLASPRAAATLMPVAMLLGGIPLLIGTTALAFGRGEAPLPSPISAPQARALRDLALDYSADRSGSVVIHTDFEQSLTWPFRDSGNVVVASRPPGDAAVLLWPPAAPPPAGYDPVAGTWALELSFESPTGGVLELLHWYADRASLEITPLPVAVYVRAGQ